jgi:hypothetical protein
MITNEDSPDVVTAHQHEDTDVTVHILGEGVSYELTLTETLAKLLLKTLKEELE